MKTNTDERLEAFRYGVITFLIEVLCSSISTKEKEKIQDDVVRVVDAILESSDIATTLKNLPKTVWDRSEVQTSLKNLMDLRNNKTRVDDHPYRDFVQCDYCLRMDDRMVGPVRLRIDEIGPNVWTEEELYICDNCKDYLRGLFRYSKPDRKPHYKTMRGGKILIDGK